MAIVDIDVHHGNGTEEIVRQLPYADKIFFTSVHIYDSVGTGANGRLLDRKLDHSLCFAKHVFVRVGTTNFTLGPVRKISLNGT